MRISDWSSDVCSSDLFGAAPPGAAARTGRIDEDARRPALPVGQHRRFLPGIEQARLDAGRTGAFGAWRQLLEPRAVGVAGADVGVVSGDRKSVGWGKSGSGGVGLGGGRILKKK